MISSLSRHGKIYILGFVRLPEATGLSDLHLIVNKIKLIYERGKCISYAPNV